MSGAARRRGRGRANAGDDNTSQSSSRRGDRLQPGAFDGPASRGSASGTGTSGARRPSNPPSVGSGRGTPQPPEGGFAPQAGQPGSRRSSVSGAASQPASQAAAQPIQRGDPARDRPDRTTDALKNVDLPASFFNIDNLVSLLLFHVYFGTFCTCFMPYNLQEKAAILACTPSSYNGFSQGTRAFFSYSPPYNQASQLLSQQKWHPKAPLHRCQVHLHLHSDHMFLPQSGIFVGQALMIESSPCRPHSRLVPDTTLLAKPFSSLSTPIPSSNSPTLGSSNTMSLLVTVPRSGSFNGRCGSLKHARKPQGLG